MAAKPARQLGACDAGMPQGVPQQHLEGCQGRQRHSAGSKRHLNRQWQILSMCQTRGQCFFDGRHSTLPRLGLVFAKRRQFGKYGARHEHGAIVVLALVQVSSLFVIAAMVLFAVIVWIYRAGLTVE